MIAARFRMVARLLRERRIRTPRQLRAFLTVPRHRFVPARLAAQSYGRDALEVGEQQTITCPDFVALMTSLLEVKPGDKVLEVGTGTGYQAAILAAAGAQVTTIEVRRSLHEQATRNLRSAGLAGVDARLGNGREGASDAAPFAAIVVACAAPTVPDALLEQLMVGGRLVAPLGDPENLQTLVRIRRTPSGFTREDIRAAWFVPMVGELNGCNAAP